MNLAEQDCTTIERRAFAILFLGNVITFFLVLIFTSISNSSFVTFFPFVRLVIWLRPS